MSVRGIRGAITVEQDQPELILSAVTELLTEICKKNPSLLPVDIASVIFTSTSDLVSVYPAVAARDLGWTKVPLMCLPELPVNGSLPRCIRVLIHWNTNLTQSEINHCYLRDAVRLRPDLMKVTTNRLILTV